MDYNFFIRGEIGSYWGCTSSEVTSFLAKHKGKVDIAICSPGGYVDAGLEMYQAFKDHGDVHCHIIGMTASAATIVAMGAKTVDIVSSSLILIHNASMMVDVWTSANKEKLEKIIKDIQKKHDDLKTIDDVLTNIYVERSGQTEDVIKAKMNAGKWLSASEAKELGLVDTIRDDKTSEDISNEMLSQFTNSIANYGLPALPTKEDKKTINWLSGVAAKAKDFLNSHKNSTVTTMKKVYKNICSLLSVKDLESKDDVISIKADDMQKIEDHITAINKEKDDVKTSLDNANNKISELEEQVKNLKGAPGDDTDDAPDDEESTNVSNRELYHIING